MSKNEKIAHDIVEDIYQEKGKDMVHGLLDSEEVMEHVTGFGYNEDQVKDITNLIMAITESN